MNNVYLALGSNLHRHRAIKFAIDSLKKHGTIFKVSSIYESVPLHAKGKNFFNLVVYFKTSLELHELFKLTKKIENEMGRDDWINNLGEKISIRCLDIDILLFNDVFSKENPQIPREDLFKYDFVVIPFNEIAPNVSIPNFNGDYQEVVKKFSNHSLVLLKNFL